jgi:hypothetical protein
MLCAIAIGRLGDRGVVGVVADLAHEARVGPCPS